jgi:serine O-acetyltransferase
MSCDVSVVIPTYNSSGTLERALASVYEQSLLPREIIVVDDGSDDWEKSRLIAASCPDRISIRFIHMDKNQGVSTARNTGVSAAQCRYLAFLDSDDVWYPDKMAIQYGLMTSRNLDFSMHQYCHDMSCLRCDSVDSHDSSSPSLSSLSPWTPLLRNDSTNSVMVLRQKMVSYDTSLRRGEDFKCYMELLSKHGSDCSGLYIRRVLAGGFKSTIGVSGLSQDVKGMHAGRTLGLKRLLEEGKISMVQYLVGMGMETVKYPVRVLKVGLRPSSDPASGASRHLEKNRGANNRPDNNKIPLRQLLYRDLARQIELEGKPAGRPGLGGLLRRLLHHRFLPIVLCRASRAARLRNLPVLPELLTYLNIVLFGLEVTPRCEIGPGIFFPHPSGTVVGAWRIGSNVTILQGVTLGAKRMDLGFDCGLRPEVGDNVVLGAGAKILGGIQIGDNVTVGANSVVVDSVEAGSTVVGIPARRISPQRHRNHDLETTASVSKR